MSQALRPRLSRDGLEGDERVSRVSRKSVKNAAEALVSVMAAGAKDRKQQIGKQDEQATRRLAYLEDLISVPTFSSKDIRGKFRSEVSANIIAARGHLKSFTSAPIPSWLRFLNACVMLAVFVSSVNIAVQIDSEDNATTFASDIVDYCCDAVFIIEIISKLCVFGRDYFNDYWNVFDMLLVFMTLVDKISSPLAPVVLLRVLRMVRIARIIRFFKLFKELWLIIVGLFSAIKAMMWVMLLLILVLYVGALMCVLIIRENADLYPGADRNLEPMYTEFNPFMYFNTVPDSMLSLFNLIVMAEFPEFARPVYMMQPYFFPFFIIFIVLCTFALLNMLVGVIVESVMEAAKLLDQDYKSEREAHRVQLILELCQCLDPDFSGEITAQEIEHAIDGNNPEAKDAMSKLNFPPGFNGEELLTLFGVQEKKAGVDEFRRNAIRVVSSEDSSFEWHSLLMLTMNKILLKVQSIENNMNFRDDFKQREQVSKRPKEMSRVQCDMEDAHEQASDAALRQLGRQRELGCSRLDDKLQASLGRSSPVSPPRPLEPPVVSCSDTRQPALRASELDATMVQASITATSLQRAAAEATEALWNAYVLSQSEETKKSILASWAASQSAMRLVCNDADLLISELSLARGSEVNVDVNGRAHLSGNDTELGRLYAGNGSGKHLQSLQCARDTASSQSIGPQTDDTRSSERRKCPQTKPSSFSLPHSLN
eukprot:TRINITY_DN37608_c0_g1_i1.p1 TRINITY_DN37608_c0_g1~~TRINITY_DN37608_c0_g1_i1.p1  ORF type:complete len:712 (-),score=81.91 TRINITY_DN37608_c0_g1_i1:320-2455(-)